MEADDVFGISDEAKTCSVTYDVGRVRDKTRLLRLAPKTDDA